MILLWRISTSQTSYARFVLTVSPIFSTSYEQLFLLIFGLWNNVRVHWFGKMLWEGTRVLAVSPIFSTSYEQLFLLIFGLWNDVRVHWFGEMLWEGLLGLRSRGRSRISRWGGPNPCWRGCQPPIQALFGKNICKNERIWSCWGGHARNFCM